MHPVSTSDVLEQIYALPETLRSHVELRREVSLLRLVNNTGYPTVRDLVDIALLREGLRKRNEIVARWLRYSAEKNAAWGWFFEVDRRGSYSVGLRSGFSEQTRCEIRDAWEACALFIKQELDAIVGSG